MTRSVPETLSFEDLPLGGEWTTRGRTITAAEVHAYMSLAGDFNPLYADEAYATRDGRGGVVVPAALISAVALGLGAMDVPLADTTALVGMSWRYLAAVRPGDTLHAEWRLGRKRPVDEPEVGLGVWQIEVRNQKDALVAEGEVARLVARRHAVVAKTPAAGEPEPSEEPLAAPANANAERPATRRRRRRGGRGGGGAAPTPSVERQPDTEETVQAVVEAAEIVSRETVAEPPADVRTERESGLEAVPQPEPAPIPPVEPQAAPPAEPAPPQEPAPVPEPAPVAEQAPPRPRRRRAPRATPPPERAEAPAVETPAVDAPAAPAPEPAPAPPAEGAPAPARRPSRRRRTTSATTETTEAAGPEPAPAAAAEPAPAPPRRPSRRRRSTPAQTAETPAAEAPAPETPTPETAAPEAPTPRPRRGRRTTATAPARTEEPAPATPPAEEPPPRAPRRRRGRAATES